MPDEIQCKNDHFVIMSEHLQNTKKERRKEASCKHKSQHLSASLMDNCKPCPSTTTALASLSSSCFLHSIPIPYHSSALTALQHLFCPKIPFEGEAHVYSLLSVLGSHLAGTCACPVHVATVSVSSCVRQSCCVRKTPFPWCHPSPLPLRIFRPPLPCCSLSLEGREGFDGRSTEDRMFQGLSHSACCSSGCGVSAFIPVYCCRKLH